MRKLRKFEYAAPRSLAEAVALLREQTGETSLLAGGTDLLVTMKQGKLTPQYVIDIKDIPGLDSLTYDPQGGLRIGPLVTMQQLVTCLSVQQHFPLLSEGALATAVPQIRNRATVAGNLCNASPAADMAPPLIAAGASLKLIGPQGERMVPVEGFFTAPFATVLEEDEILAEIAVPSLPRGSGSCYQWLPKTTVVDETLVGAAVVITLDRDGACQDARIGLGSVAPTPLRARQAEEVLRGHRVVNGTVEEAARVAAGESVPRSRAEYRREMVQVMVEEALRRAVERAQQA